MPELPEVEVVRRQLSVAQQAQPEIQEIRFFRKDLRDVMPQKKLKALAGAKILQIQRRAKYLLIETSKGGILSHLGMTGQWRVLAPPAAKDFVKSRGAHDHLQIVLTNGESLVFRDPRRFGIFETYEPLADQKKNPRLAHLGPEPLSSEFNVHYLQAKLKARSGPIKSVIMDQKLVVGVGNIYASEALFHAKIHPLTVAAKLATRKQEARLALLVDCIRQVLSEAIAKGGSTIADFKSMSGDEGGFQNFHYVYARQGEPCLLCETKIRSQVLAGRSTFWCPSCQK